MGVTRVSGWRPFSLSKMTTIEKNQLIREALGGVSNQEFIPQYVDSKGLARLTGISRSYAYLLLSEGKIDSACIRRPGSIRGKRLWHIPSVLMFLESCKAANCSGGSGVY